jgi:hypothetical protein
VQQRQCTCSWHMKSTCCLLHRAHRDSSVRTSGWRSAVWLAHYSLHTNSHAHVYLFRCRSRYATAPARAPCIRAMAVNPALVQTYEGRLVPAPFANEVFVLTRPKVGFELDGVQTRSGKCVARSSYQFPCSLLLLAHAAHAAALGTCRWSTTGALFLSNVRVVFLADKADASGG